MEKLELAPIAIGKLLNIGGMLEKSGNKLLLPFNLNQPQYSILFAIKKAGKVQQKNMVNKLLLEKAHVSKIVKKLNAMELIKITKDNFDKRVYWLTTTEKGNNTVDECQKIMNEWNKKWINLLDNDQMESIINNLDILQKIFGEIN